MRIGIGYDVHAFVEGRPLVLGGVTIPYEYGLAGHSDADVLAHALMDAILGAAREGDIGKLFPDTDERFRGISSMVLLERVAAHVRDLGWVIEDADCVISLEQPRVSPYREQMRETLARHLGATTEQVGIKATTTEGLGFTGRQEGVAAWAVALLAPA
ncbi:MAG: 2-C-methyl-D-erythritol 2,4-cyclodiphosphate synthase [Coriobacteriales bacterium]|nr:2-C-methyl-D-erythritol 2,4-cyclodiphosphate synthase [Coriobacteriales bacterium]